MNLINGTLFAKEIETQIAHSVSHLTHRKPGLAFVLVGKNPASQSYIRMKKKKCAEVGIVSFDCELPETTSEATLLETIDRLNQDTRVDGILVQLPLPEHLQTSRIISAIDPNKDVDGFHPLNMGKLLLGEQDGFFPCTPLGIHVLLAKAQVPLLGKHVVIIGRSNIVGKPLAAILMQKAPHCNATVTVAHSLSENLDELCKSADVLIAAIGKPHFITEDKVKKGAVVIDVGINRMTTSSGENKLVGDVDFVHVAPLCSQITPVPGGVGPMTIAVLLSNTILSYQRRVEQGMPISKSGLF